MAKKKNNNGFSLFKLLVLVFSALVVVTFFLPVFSANEDYALYDENSKVSSANLVFVSEEKAEEKQEELLKSYTNGDIEKEEYEKGAAKYLAIAGFKDEDFEERDSVVAVAWLHFVAAVLALCSFVVVILSLLGIKLDKFAKFALCGSVVLLIVALIVALSFLGKDTVLSGLTKNTYGDLYVLSFGGVVLGLVASALGAVSAFLASPCKKAKK